MLVFAVENVFFVTICLLKRISKVVIHKYWHDVQQRLQILLRNIFGSLCIYLRWYTIVFNGSPITTLFSNKHNIHKTIIWPAYCLHFVFYCLLIVNNNVQNTEAMLFLLHICNKILFIWQLSVYLKTFCCFASFCVVVVHVCAVSYLGFKFKLFKRKIYRFVSFYE